MTSQDLEQYKISILKTAEKINCPFNVSKELKIAYSNSRAIDDFLLNEYFPIQKTPSIAETNKQLKKILKEFEKDVLKKLLEAKQNFKKERKETKLKNQNLFLIAGTKNLYLSNKYTRTISTTLGNRLERILDIDNSKCFDTETIFNLKIKGIDKFILDENKRICHVQIKTKKDTLTGSQAKRSVMELGIHPKPIFAALFDIGRWHFPKHEKITRMAGSDFWTLAGLEYQIVFDEVCKSLQRIEKALF